MSTRNSGLFTTIALVAMALAPAVAMGRPGYPAIKVLSSRADLVAGGEAVVAVNLPPRTRASRVRVRLGSRNVSRAFAVRPNGGFEGLVTGLRLGRNVLTALLPNGHGGRITINNHPNGGPVFAGPQVQPWVCQKTAVDSLCDEPAKFSYLYKSTDASKTDLQPYDPQHPPSDVATTTTDAGVTVPFIVREETGYEDRDRYRIETLYQPAQSWSRWAPQKQFNHKLPIVHGGSCHSSYGPTNPPWGNGALTGTPGMDDITTVALGRGLTVASTALDNSGQDCSPVLQAESILMVKEHILDSYGDLRFTIG